MKQDLPHPNTILEDIDGEAIRESFSKSIVKVDGLFTSA